MYPSYNYPYYYENNLDNSNENDERFLPFLGPFLLGGVTGALVAPAFYNNRPCCYNNYPPMYYPPYQYNYFPTYYRSKG